MYFCTALVLFLTSICTCYMQPYQEALNNTATRIFPPRELPRGHLCFTSNTSFSILKMETGNNTLKKYSQSTKLSAYGKNGQFPPNPETPEEKPKDMYVPFDYNYTTKTEEFFTCATMQFYAFLTKTVQMETINFLSHYFHKEEDVDRTCDTEEISEAPYYQPSKKDSRECRSTCIGLNATYVKFLNKNISRLSEHFFSGRIFVKLHPINTNVGDCVHNEKKNTYDCKCKSNYQITIDRYFYVTVRDILNSEEYKDRVLTYTDYFVTALVFLKFLPHTAPLYIAFLFFQYNLHWTRNNQRETNSDITFVPAGVEGSVEERDIFRKVDDQLLEIIFRTAAFGQLNLYILAALFRNYLQSDGGTLM